MCKSRFKRKFTAIIARLSAGFAVLSAHTMCAGVNEHRYACISIKGKYDERKTGHVAAVFRTCRAHNASDRSLSMWRRKRRPRNAIISLLISSRSIHNFSLCISMTLRIITRVSPLPEMCSARCFIFATEKDLSIILTFYRMAYVKEDWALNTDCKPTKLWIGQSHKSQSHGFIKISIILNFTFFCVTTLSTSKT